MVRERDVGELFEHFDVGEIADFVGFFDHAVEVAHRLVRVEQTDKTNAAGHDQKPLS
jgi:hypothetical protein